LALEMTPFNKMIIGMAFEHALKERLFEVQAWRLFVEYYEIELLIGFPHLTALPIKTLSNISNHLYNERQARKDI
jgi:hypothetical protein